MIALLQLVLSYIRDSVRSREELKVEIILLRQQLSVLRRQVPDRVRLRGFDRALLIWLYRLFPAFLRAVVIVRPETVIGWHRAGYRAWWRWKSRAPAGRPTIERELRDLIRQMCRENPL